MPAVWLWKHLGECCSPIHAESLQIMYQAVQRTRWYRHAVRETQLPAVGDSDLPRHHQPQGHIQHETAQGGYWHYAEDRVVSDDADP